jgi:hypothetical protein
MGIPVPLNEKERLDVLRSFEILGTESEGDFDALAHLAVLICGTPMASITLVDDARSWVKSRVGFEFAETPRELSFSAYAILQKGPLIVPDALEDTRFSTNLLVTTYPDIRFYCGVPLINEKTGLALGTLCVMDRVPRNLKAAQIDALEVIGHQVIAQLELRLATRALERTRTQRQEMVELHNKQLQAALKRVELTYDETLEALGIALDLRDNETAGHSRRVTHYCHELSDVMCCNQEQWKQIERGSNLHDIGKIGIPDSILLKPSPLTPEEKKIMDTHAQIGYEIVCRIAFLSRAAQIVLTHQERFDGSGYPQGLAGENIPLGSRIFAVADTLDAMTSDRPYRRALPFSEARAEIIRKSGSQFDSEIVKAFISISPDIWLRIRSDVDDRRQSFRQLAEAI